MNSFDKLESERQIAMGWFDGCYTAAQVEAIAKEKGYSMVMIKHYYGVEYHEQEAASR